jgi:hypothetical protein
MLLHTIAEPFLQHVTHMGKLQAMHSGHCNEKQHPENPTQKRTDVNDCCNLQQTQPLASLLIIVSSPQLALTRDKHSSCCNRRLLLSECRQADLKPNSMLQNHMKTSFRKE